MATDRGTRLIRDDGSEVGVVAVVGLGSGGAFSVSPVMSTNPSTAQVSVGTTATQILGTTTAATPREIKNTSTATVFIGASGVTTTTGHALLPNEAFTVWWTGPTFGIVASGTATVTTCA